MILQPWERKAFQKASGKNKHSGPGGWKSRPGKLHGIAAGVQYKEAHKRPIWELLAHQGNFIGAGALKG